jgi:hypothetical protein
MSRPLQNESVKRENPIIWQEEKEALYLLFREAVEREQSSVPWAALYLLLFFPDLVRMHVQRRLNPDVILRPPSAFVYCMQLRLIPHRIRQVADFGGKIRQIV